MSNPKAPTKRFLYVFTLFAATVVAGLAMYVKLAPADKVPAQEHRDNAVSRPAPQIDVTTKRSGAIDGRVEVFAAQPDGDGVKFTSRTVAVPDGEDAKTFAVNEFLKSSNIPDTDARLLSVSVEDRVAKLYFNAAFEGGYGTMDEGVLLEGLGRSLGQFAEVDKFEIFVDGKPLDSLGNVELESGLDVKRP